LVRKIAFGLTISLLLMAILMAFNLNRLRLLGPVEPSPSMLMEA